MGGIAQAPVCTQRAKSATETHRRKRLIWIITHLYRNMAVQAPLGCSCLTGEPYIDMRPLNRASSIQHAAAAVTRHVHACVLFIITFGSRSRRAYLPRLCASIDPFLDAVSAVLTACSTAHILNVHSLAARVPTRSHQSSSSNAPRPDNPVSEG
jgi:hypothetical protein